jgi:voltage-gated potassium channel
MIEEQMDASAQRKMIEEDPSGRLSLYTARTQTALDFLALATVWIVAVPPGKFGAASTVVLIARIALSVIYGIDITVRAWLARRHWHYLISHPIGIAVVFFPPVRVIFSLRLLRSVFRRGHIERFLLVAAMLVFEGSIVVYLFERHAAGSNIHTLGVSVWWSIVTVTTVGYGDYYPVTTPGRITAVLVMFIGILTLAVVTAQVAASFVDQASRRSPQSAPSSQSPAVIPTAQLTELNGRLTRIEELLIANAGSSSLSVGEGRDDIRREAESAPGDPQ